MIILSARTQHAGAFVSAACSIHNSSIVRNRPVLMHMTRAVLADVQAHQHGTFAFMKTGRPKYTAEQRIVAFWAKVDKSGGDDACWIWKGGTNKRGYGRFRSTKIIPAHKFSYELAFGTIRSDLFVLHKCDNPRCVNPRHLFTGTHLDNMEDRQKKGRTISGDAHWRHKYPERVKRGVQVRNSKL